MYISPESSTYQQVAIYLGADNMYDGSTTSKEVNTHILEQLYTPLASPTLFQSTRVSKAVVVVAYFLGLEYHVVGTLEDVNSPSLIIGTGVVMQSKRLLAYGLDNRCPFLRRRHPSRESKLWRGTASIS